MLKQFLEKNKIKEPKHICIGYRFYPPLKIIFKYHDNYLEFLKINKGNENSEDESIYTNFLGCYEYSNEPFNNPYITYHPGGILDFKTLSGKKLLTDKICSQKFDDIKENKIFEIFSIEISPSLFSKLDKISINSIEKLHKRKWINLLEIGPFSNKRIKQHEAKETYIIFDIDIKKNVNLYFSIHKITDNKVLNKLSDDDYISAFFLNSNLCLTIFIKKDNIKTKNDTQDLKVIMREESFNLKLANKMTN